MWYVRLGVPAKERYVGFSPTRQPAIALSTGGVLLLDEDERHPVKPQGSPTKRRNPMNLVKLDAAPLQNTQGSDPRVVRIIAFIFAPPG